MHKSIDFLKEFYQKHDVRGITTGEKKNIVFLDIDGVLKPYYDDNKSNYHTIATSEYLKEKYNDPIYTKMKPYDVGAVYYDFDDIAIGILKQILNRGCAYIVIHSDWRKYFTLEELKALFRLHGLDDYIIDACELGEKPVVIKKYLEEHKDEICDYVVIDDLEMTQYFGEHYIKTNNVLNMSNYYNALYMFKIPYTFTVNGKMVTVKKFDNDIMNVHVDLLDSDDRSMAILSFERLYPYVDKYDYLIIKNHMTEFLYKNKIDTYLIDEKIDFSDRICIDTPIKKSYDEERCLYFFSLRPYLRGEELFFKEYEEEIIKHVKEKHREKGKVLIKE